MLKALKDHDITVIKDLTKWWGRCGKSSGKDLQVFIADLMMRQRMLTTLGAGILIRLRKPIPGKLREVKFENNTRHGRIKTTKVVEIRRLDNDELVGETTTRRLARPLMRKLIRKEKTDLYAITKYISNEIDMIARFNQSNGEQLGLYMVFGVDESDARLYKRREMGLES